MFGLAAYTVGVVAASRLMASQTDLPVPAQWGILGAILVLIVFTQQIVPGSFYRAEREARLKAEERADAAYRLVVDKAVPALENSIQATREQSELTRQATLALAEVAPLLRELMRR
jgi:hypothetical protein